MNLSYRSLLSAGTGLAVTVGSIGLGFIFTQPVLAGTKLFTNQMIKVSPDELFVFDLITDDSPTTESHLGYMNPGVVTPNPNAPLPPPSREPGTLLTSEPYTFKGYKIQQLLNGKRYTNGVYDGDIKYRGETLPAPPPYVGTNAEDVGVFNYRVKVEIPNPDPLLPPTVIFTYPTDLIAHALPDDLWNPGEEGLGFSFTPSLPSSALDNHVSFGGFAFDVFEAGTSVFDEPYQIFTVSKQPTSGGFTYLVPGDYAGCPGSCVSARVNPVPGPLPLLGIGAAFGFSRKLRKRIKGSKTPDVFSALG
jgi:hypothetical protein